ncbi:MAG: tRNA preQ1(34) S-adenosylmethionine ribosyltransferase-isomerase QueA [Candidatus Scalinduaceae bacterium]
MSLRSFKITDYDYTLPRKLIAQHPKAKRDESRLLVLHRKSSRIEHKRFFEIIEYFNSGDVLVLNDTKVIHAKISGYRITGGKVEALVIKEINDGVWEMLLRSNNKLMENEPLFFDDKTLKGEIVCKNKTGSWVIKFKDAKKFIEFLENSGRMPLPPYIKRNSEDEPLRKMDEKCYQTIYAKKTGAIAAPTAGLHFTETLLEKINKKGIKIVYLTLHVGLGTFKSIKEENFTKHTMHKEFYTISKETIDKINKAKLLGKKIIATGTTACRVLETIARNGKIKENSGWTDLFIYPPYNFMLTDSLITNFHLQKTSLILLVSAFAGRENILEAYETAISLGYRFYSYGDCMLVI